MKSVLNRMEKAIDLFLEKNDMNTDVKFYNIIDWKKRNEPYNNDSDLVMVIDCGFGEVLNGYYGEELNEEFYDLIESFGYYFEMGHSWNGGFYKIPDYIFNSPKDKSYSEKLKDHRWKEKRKKVKEKASHICQDCSKSVPLEIHHTYYVYGNEPWEYPIDSLRAICNSCHIRRGKIERIFRAKLADITCDQIISLQKVIDNAFYWYSQEEVCRFLDSFSNNETKMRKRFEIMLETKIENE